MLAVTVIVTAVRVKIRWIAIEKTTFGIPAANNIQCIGTFDLAILQTDSKFLCKPFLSVADLLGGGAAGLIVTPGTVQLGAVTLGTEYPHGPSPFDIREHVG